MKTSGAVGDGNMHIKFRPAFSITLFSAGIRMENHRLPAGFSVWFLSVLTDGKYATLNLSIK